MEIMLIKILLLLTGGKMVIHWFSPPSLPEKYLHVTYLQEHINVYIVVLCNIPKGPTAEAARQKAISTDSFIICAISTVDYYDFNSYTFCKVEWGKQWNELIIKRSSISLLCYPFIPESSMSEDNKIFLLNQYSYDDYLWRINYHLLSIQMCGEVSGRWAELKSIGKDLEMTDLFHKYV